MVGHQEFRFGGLPTTQSSGTMAFGQPTATSVFGKQTTSSFGLVPNCPGTSSRKQDKILQFNFACTAATNTTETDSVFSFGEIKDTQKSFPLENNVDERKISDVTTADFGKFNLKTPPLCAQPSHKYIIIDEGKSGGRMTLKEQGLLTEALDKTLIDVIMEVEANDEKSIFQIYYSKFERGVLQLAIKSEEDVEPLKALVEKLPTLWSNFKPKLVELKDIPKLPKAMFYVNNLLTKISSETILKLLAKQNRNLKVELWEVIKREPAINGDKIILEIDDDTVKHIQSEHGCIFLLHSTVTFLLEHHSVNTEDQANVDDDVAIKPKSGANNKPRRLSE